MLLNIILTYALFTFESCSTNELVEPLNITNPKTLDILKDENVTDSLGQTILDSKSDNNTDRLNETKQNDLDKIYLSTQIPCNLYKGPLPDKFDWRLRQKVSSIKDQRRCSACWAFSITATLESHMMIYGKSGEKNLDLSEQMLIDCLDSSPGCKSGSLLQSYADLSTNLGYMVLEKDYPYTASDNQKCQKNRIDLTSYSISGFKRVVSDEEEMKRHLVMCGPLTAGINSMSMDKYNSNVIDEPTEEECPTDVEHMNHAVEIVGYDYYRDDTTEDKSKQYWIIKNSWGDWGVQGFYYLVLGRNACGIANDVSLPFVL